MDTLTTEAQVITDKRRMLNVHDHLSWHLGTSDIPVILVTDGLVVIAGVSVI